jgi:hypothetical protein
MKAQRKADVYLNYFFNLGTIWGVGGQRHALAALPRASSMVPTVQDVGWSPQPA